METSTKKTKLTLDIIIEILVRLPPKPLARLKCVSKLLNYLINTRQFLLTHIKSTSQSLSSHHVAILSNPNPNPDPSLLTLPLPTLNNPTPPQPLPLPFTPVARDSHIFGSVHGLLGISDYPNSLSLYNPTNNTFHVIPSKPIKPLTQAHWVDFSVAYDPSTDDYKVLQLNQLNGPHTFPLPEVRVYSLKRASWRKLKQKFPLHLAYPKSKSNPNGKFVSYTNTVLWVCSVGPPTAYEDEIVTFKMVALDVCDETFSVSDLPGLDGKDAQRGPRPSLVVSRGKDVLCQVEKGREVEVWLRRENGVGEWVKLFRMECMGGARPVVVSEDGREVLMENIMGCGYFWVEVGSGEVIREVTVGGFSGGVVYVDSLVELDNPEEDDEEEDEEEEWCGGGHGVAGVGVVVMIPLAGFMVMSMAERRRRPRRRSREV